MVIDLFLLVGFAVALVLITRLRHTNMQIAGFIAMAAGLVTLSFSTTLPEGSVKSLVLVFAGFILFNICMNAGPNSTTFLLPAEVFPTRVRELDFVLGFRRLPVNRLDRFVEIRG